MTQTFQLARDSARHYEERLVPAFFEPCADLLLPAAGLQVGERVLDLACGTGAVTRRAAGVVGPGGSVAGVDLNQPMLELAAEVSATAGPIEWKLGDAAALPLPDESVDVVLCQQGLQFFPDRPAALREVHRVLVPGGRLALAMWRDLGHQAVFARFVDVLDRHVGAGAGDMMRGPFAGPSRTELATLVAEAGFTSVRARIGVVVTRFASIREFVRDEVASTPLAAPLGQLGKAERAALAEDLERELEPMLDDDGLVVVLPTWLLTAQAPQRAA